MPQSKIVILEADQNRRDYIRSIVSDRGCISYIFEKETICLDNLIPLDPDLVISGPLSAGRVARFVNTVKMKDSSLPVLIISRDRTLRDSAISNGFSDVKVINVNFVLSEIRAAINNLLQNRVPKPGNGDLESPLIIGNSHEILKIRKLIQTLKGSREPVLIQGEPGTGKELVVRALHHHSGQCGRPFVKVNLAGLDFEMLDEIFFENLPVSSTESEHSFDRIAPAENCGTIFLDKIAALPPLHQSRLLDFLEDGYFQQNFSGSGQQNMTHARVVAASSSNLERLIRQGKFRQELFYRLNVISIIMPPLRERIEDIPMLMDFFADKLCMLLGIGHIELSSQIKDIFCSYHWPGNVRELQNMTRRVILNGHKDSLINNLSQLWIQNKKRQNPYDDVDTLTGINLLRKRLKNLDNLSLKNVCSDFLIQTEKKIISTALDQTSWNRKKAATLLDISYKSLLNKIKKYKLAR